MDEQAAGVVDGDSASEAQHLVDLHRARVDLRDVWRNAGRVGVRFTQEPLKMQSVTTAVLDDTCGNLIQIASQGDGG